MSKKFAWAALTLVFFCNGYSGVESVSGPVMNVEMHSSDKSDCLAGAGFIQIQDKWLWIEGASPEGVFMLSLAAKAKADGVGLRVFYNTDKTICTSPSSAGYYKIDRVLYP